MTRPRPGIDMHVEAEIGRAAGMAVRRMREVLAAPHFIRDARTRYEQGQKDYGFKYEWLEWPEGAFDGEVYTEALDFVIYQAMLRVALDRRGR